MTARTEYRLLPKQWDFLFGMPIDEIRSKVGADVYNDISLYQGGVTCKKASAEWLSPTGWKTMDKLTKDDLMAVYYPEDCSFRFEHPQEVFVWDADEWYELDSRSIHQINCPNHRMYTTKDGRDYIQSMEEFYREHQNSKNGHRGKFTTTFNTHGTLSVDENTLRLAVAFQADGYLIKSRQYRHAFHYKKERKKERLEKLLKAAKIDYYTREEKDGYYRTYCTLERIFKEYPREWYNLDETSLLVIADEVQYWDSSIEKTNFSYYSSSKVNVDFIQFAASVAGYKSTVSSRVRKAKIHKNTHTTEWVEYKVKCQKNNVSPSLYSTRNKNIIKHYKAEPNEKKYCPSTSTKLWLCREFGRITVTGNSGKTFSGSLRGLLYALKWAGCRGLVGAKSQDLLDNTTKKTYLDHIQLMGLKEGVHWWYRDRGTQIQFKNGSVIRFKTLSDWENLMSESFTWIEFEEASFIDEVTFKKLITRLREIRRPEWKDYHHSMFLHTNPQGKRGWIYKLFINPKTRMKDYRYVCASSKENYHLGDGYIDLLRDLYSEEEFNEMVEGLDVETDNTVAFPSFGEDNIIDHIEYNPNARLILSCDFNFNPMCWYLMQEYDGKWFALKELIVSNTTTKEMCRAIQTTIDQYGTKDLVIMGDAHGRDRKTNGSDYSVMSIHFTQAGYSPEIRVQKANPLIKDRLSVLRGLIRNAKGERRFFIDSSCKKLIYNLTEATNDLAKAGLHIPTDNEIKADPQKLYLIHPIDAISYPMYYLSRMREMSGEDVHI